MRSAGMLIAGFFALSFLVYGTAVRQSEFVRWDDGMLVYENPAIRAMSPATIKYVFSTYDPELYIPLTFLSYQLDYQIGGIHPFQYHLTSFLFHTLNGILVAWFATLFFRGSKTRAEDEKWNWSVPAGIFCGALFLLHPLHTEAVMWVSGRKDLLSTFFFLLTIITWMYWREERVRRLLVAASGFFALALLSKVMAITLPVILVLLDWRDGRIAWPFGGRREGRSEGRSIAAPLQWVRTVFEGKIPFLVLSVIFGLIGIGGKTSVVASSSTWEKIIMAGKSSLFYVRKIVWPDFFSLLYPYHGDVTVSSPDFFVPIIVWGVIVLLIAAACIAAAEGRAMHHARGVIFGLGFFFITLAPTFLNFTKGGDLDVYFASDRYAYVPSIGVFIALIAFVLVLAEIVAGKKGGAMTRPYISRYGWACVAGMVIMFLAWRAHAQSLIWQNTFTLLTNVLQHYPETHVAHNNLGNVYRFDEEYDKAIIEYEKALAIREHPKTLSNLGAAYRKLGQYDKAIATYQRALAINPDSKDAHLGLGIIYAELKKLPQAEAEYRRAAELDPTYEEAFTNLGVALFGQGKTQEAVQAYRRALGVNPFFTNAHYNLAIALTQMGDLDGAIAEYAEAVNEAPASVAARINLALLLYKTGDTDGARGQFEIILRIDPSNVAAKSALRQMGAQ